DTRTVKFKVDGDLSQPVSMEMHIVVPDLYDTTHTARAVFDVSGLEQAGSTASKEDSSDEDNATPAAGSNKAEENPPTGDSTPIVMYTILLVGSVVALVAVRKLRPAKNYIIVKGEKTLMKKFFSILLTLTIAFFTLPFSGNTVLADGKNIADIEDGDYDITAKALHETEDKASGAAGFINEEAVLSIKDGKAQLTITVPKTDGAEITGLQVEGLEAVVNEGQDAKDMTYELTNLKSELNAQVQYEVPLFGLDHDVPFRFILEGLDDLPVKEEEATEPEDDDTDGVEEDNDKGNNDSEEGTEPEEEPEQDSEDSVIKLDKGYYTIDASYLRDDNDNKSSMANYLESPVFLEVKDGKVFATITISEDETVTKMQVEGKNAVNKVVDGKKRHETFELDQLDSIINAYVEYQAPFQGDVFEGNANFRISFDKDSVEKSKKSAKPGIDVEQDTDKDSDKNK